MKEYVIWGIPSNGIEEELLLTKFDNKTITDKELAASLAILLETKYGWKSIRIQTIDLSETITKTWTSKNLIK